MDKFRFLKWPVYKDAKELFSLILKIVESKKNLNSPLMIS